MPFEHITPVRMVVCRIMFDQIFFGNDSIELLEIMFDGRAFPYLSVGGGGGVGWKF